MYNYLITVFLTPKGHKLLQRNSFEHVMSYPYPATDVDDNGQIKPELTEKIRQKFIEDVMPAELFIQYTFEVKYVGKEIHPGEWFYMHVNTNACTAMSIPMRVSEKKPTTDAASCFLLEPIPELNYLSWMQMLQEGAYTHTFNLYTRQMKFNLENLQGVGAARLNLRATLMTYEDIQDIKFIIEKQMLDSQVLGTIQKINTLGHLIPMMPITDLQEALSLLEHAYCIISGGDEISDEDQDPADYSF